MNANILFRIRETYKKCESCCQTAKICNCSENTVVKCLVSFGEFKSETSEKVIELWNQGKTIAEISELLKMSKTAVNKYIPYTRGTYLTNTTEKTENALRIAKCRRKKKEGV